MGSLYNYVTAILSITVNWSNTRICKLIDHCWKCCATSPLPHWLFSGDTILNQMILLSDGIYTPYSHVVLWVSWLYSSAEFISKRPIKKKRENETQKACNTMKDWEYKELRRKVEKYPFPNCLLHCNIPLLSAHIKFFSAENGT